MIKAGNGVNIVHEEIVVEVYLPTCPDLTIIDLPGLVINKVEGQPEDIREQIENLVYKYCSDENTIIMCVSPADIDLAADNGIYHAKKVDPSMKRILGVLTKSDLGKPEELKKALDGENETVRFTRGFNAVINRNKKQEAAGMTIQKSIQEEECFFQQQLNGAFKGINPNQLGIRTLNKKLTKMLAEQIKESLAGIEGGLKREKFQLERSLKYDFPKALNEFERMLEIHSIISSYWEIYDSLITGNYSTQTHHVISPEIHPGTMGAHSKKINLYLYHREMNKQPSASWDKAEVMNQLRTMAGDKQAGSYNNALFQLKMKVEFDELPVEVNKFIDAKCSLIKTTCDMVLKHVCSKYPKLLD